jgi:hypothetical protein
MRVKMIEARAGHADETYNLPDNFSFRPGEIVDLDDALAAAWIESGEAEAVDEVEPSPAAPTKKAAARASSHGSHERK